MTDSPLPQRATEAPKTESPTAVATPATTPWYVDAVIYEVHVKAFYDANNDGIGDFAGLLQKLDYLQDLGITAIWLLPFYPSPLRDDGYDISDYRSVHPSYGTTRDFRAFVREAHRRGLRVITELVINHTSDQHAWFKRARTAKPGSALRDFYVWSDTDQKYLDTRVIFVDAEKSNWSWDPEAHAYFWHRFYSHQPDLNYDNPRVLKTMLSVMKYWLDIGVDGLRLDAIPYLAERDGTTSENLPETHHIVRQIRAHLDAHYSDRMLLAEANQWPEDVRPYFGDGDECHMAYHFPLMPRIYMALAQEDRHPITDIMRQTPDLPTGCQWAIFLRNHDELTLEMVTDRERDYLWRYYASDARARLNLGIRRRLAPLLENDRRKIELLNSLLFSMPGTPIIYYGDEIGMGDNIFLGDRDGVRTPMQWGPDRNAGFSRADPQQLFLPPITDPVYGFEAVNVEAQNRSPASLLNWMKRLIAVRKAHPAFAHGRMTFLYPGNRKVLAHVREAGDDTVLCVANLSRASQPVELDLSEYHGRIPVELLGRSVFPPIGDLPYFITLPGHGFYWFLLTDEATAPSWHESHSAPAPDLTTLVLPQGWASLISETSEPRRWLEDRVLPSYIGERRWFGGKDDTITKASLIPLAEFPEGSDGTLWAEVMVSSESNGDSRRYALPLCIRWGDRGEELVNLSANQVIASVRRGPRPGLLLDATASDDFIHEVVHAIRERREIPSHGGRLVFASTGAFPESLNTADLAVRRQTREQSNTSVWLDDVMMLKFYRYLQAGVHPEIEIGRHLTEVAGFTATPAVYGSVSYVKPDGSSTALMLLVANVQNQGDAWTMTLEYLKRFFEEADLLPEHALGDIGERHAAFLSRIIVLGRRTAEMHRALSIPTKNPDLAPKPIQPRDLASWQRQIQRQARQAFAALRRMRGRLRPEDRNLVARLLRSRGTLAARIEAEIPDIAAVTKIRCHGDLHLGQVLVTKDDFVLIDFEGEPARPLNERRAKYPALRDVAGMLRSLDYAAAAALHELAAVRAESVSLLEALAEDWRRRAKSAFLEGYRAAIQDCPCYPADAIVAARLLDLFLLDKGLYEICYESSHRISWIRIPVSGVIELVEAQP